MSEAPERIWLPETDAVGIKQYGYVQVDVSNVAIPISVEYIRADEYDRVTQDKYKLCEQRTELEAENKRLRDALKDITTSRTGEDGTVHYFHGFQAIISIAKQALKGADNG